MEPQTRRARPRSPAGRRSRVRGRRPQLEAAANRESQISRHWFPSLFVGVKRVVLKRSRRTDFSVDAPGVLREFDKPLHIRLVGRFRFAPLEFKIQVLLRRRLVPQFRATLAKVQDAIGNLLPPRRPPWRARRRCCRRAFATLGFKSKVEIDCHGSSVRRLTWGSFRRASSRVQRNGSRVPDRGFVWNFRRGFANGWGGSKALFRAFGRRTGWGGKHLGGRCGQKTGAAHVALCEFRVAECTALRAFHHELKILWAALYAV